MSSVRSMAWAVRRRLGVTSTTDICATMLASGWLDHIDTDWEDERVSAAQSLYLSAFERWLRDPSEKNADERAFWLRGIFHEAKITPPWEVLGIPQPTGRRWNIPPSKSQ